MNAPRAQTTLGQRLAIVASVVVLATVVASVWVSGSPSAQREARLDERRIRDLDNIMDLVHAHGVAKGVLPVSLAALSGQPGIRLSIVDPVSGAPYEFIATGAKTYQLCAKFTTDTAQLPPTDYPANGTKWVHGAGRQCFDRTIATVSGLPSD